MTSFAGHPQFQRACDRGLQLALRRLRDLRDLQHSGRYRFYGSETEFRAMLDAAERSAVLWKRLADGRPDSMAAETSRGQRPDAPAAVACRADYRT